MKRAVLIWDALNQEEEDAEVITVDDWGQPFDTLSIPLRDAAQQFMKKRWADSDHVNCMRVRLRPSGGGSFVEFDVYAEPSVNFRAVPRPLP